jgi:hypothetical protein
MVLREPPEVILVPASGRAGVGTQFWFSSKPRILVFYEWLVEVPFVTQSFLVGFLSVLPRGCDGPRAQQVGVVVPGWELCPIARC